jgi:hypothetical protein
MSVDMMGNVDRHDGACTPICTPLKALDLYSVVRPWRRYLASFMYKMPFIKGAMSCIGYSIP